MAFYSNGIPNIDSQGIVDLPLYTTGNLPITATAGYLAYIQDQKSLTVNTGDSANLWKVFLTVPNSYKNEIILEQGVISGGYFGPNSYNYMSRLAFSSDASIQLNTVLPFNQSRGGQHATWQYAYYHSGSATASAKQDWATFTVSSITSRPGISGNLSASLNPGAKGENLYGVIISGGISNTLTFSTDSWVVGNYNSPVALNYGVFGESYGYGMSFSAGTVYKLVWNTATWLSTGAGVARGSSGSGALNSKWKKWYQGGTGATADVYNTDSDTFVSLRSTPGVFQQQASIMGQDWGYWFGYLGGYNGNAYRTIYTLNTTLLSSSRATLPYSAAGASGTSGPIA
jgi:hypothetical protein